MTEICGSPRDAVVFSRLAGCRATFSEKTKKFLDTNAHKEYVYKILDRYPFSFVQFHLSTDRHIYEQI